MVQSFSLKRVFDRLLDQTGQPRTSKNDSLMSRSPHSDPFRRVNKLIDQGKFSKAIPLLEELIKEYPDEPSLYRDLAMCYEETDNAERGIAVANDGAMCEDRKPMSCRGPVYCQRIESRVRRQPPGSNVPRRGAAVRLVSRTGSSWPVIACRSQEGKEDVFVWNISERK